MSILCVNGSDEPLIITFKYPLVAAISSENLLARISSVLAKFLYASRCNSESGLDSSALKKTANADFPDPYGPTKDHERGLSSNVNVLATRSSMLIALDVGR